MCCPEHVGHLEHRHEMRDKAGRVTRYAGQQKLGSMPEEMGTQVKFWREL